MTPKDYFEIAYWIISLLILGVTVYWIAISPIKAVETGRKLDEEKNKYEYKKELFLTLFSLRGNPTSYEFVNKLNQIDIVFQDDDKVLDAWNKLFDSLGQKDLVNQYQTYEILRTNLLSEMAQTLGYKKLKQTDILKNYSPIAHSKDADDYFAHRKAERDFFESGAKLYNMHISSIEENYNNTDKKLES